MREWTREFLLSYLADETKWPFVWDGTMGPRTTISGVYYSLVACVRENCETLIITPYGLRREIDGKSLDDWRITKEPTNLYKDAISIMLSRDRIVRDLVKKKGETETEEGVEIEYSIDPDEFERIVDEDAKKGEIKGTLEKLVALDIQIPPRRTHIPTNALATSVSFGKDSIQVFLEDGRMIRCPLAWFPVLDKASPEERERYEIVGGGLGLYWPELKEDILVASLLTGGGFAEISQEDS